MRRLTFDHSDHQSRACTACHRDEPLLRFDAGCAACHDAHHDEEADCLTCHSAVDTPAHDSGVHAGCAGSECHAPDALPALAPTRALCLTCHSELMDHKPGQDCVACHRGAWTVRRSTGGDGP